MIEKIGLHTHVITIAVAVSYLTLGLANTSQAKNLWWAYGTSIFVLAVFNLVVHYNCAKENHGK